MNLNTILKFILVFTYSIVLASANYSDYCKLGCGFIMHSQCQQFCVSQNCRPLPPDRHWRKLILKYHNYYRNLIAFGNDTRGYNGTASNMMALSYDMELEYVAACWIYETGMPTYDRCMRTNRFNTSSQNILSVNDFRTEEHVKEMVKEWYNAITFMDDDIVDKYEDSIAARLTYHPFAQLARATTTHVGCGRCYGLLGKPIVACNYGNVRNSHESSVFLRGSPASKCPKGTSRNSEYPGMCGKVEYPRDFNISGLIYTYVRIEDNCGCSDTTWRCGFILTIAVFLI